MSKNNAAPKRYAACLGFVLARKVGDEFRQRLLKDSKAQAGEVRASLFSYFWRSDENYASALTAWKAGDEKNWRPEPKYWSSFTQCLTMWPEEPDAWQKRWSFGTKGDAAKNISISTTSRQNLIQSMGQFPNAMEATWLIEQAISQNDLHAALLDTLWAIRRNGSRAIKESKGLQSWLVDRSTNARDDLSRFKAASILFNLFGESESARALISNVKQVDPARAEWTAATTLSLEVDPKGAILDSFQAQFKKDANVGPWFTWLIKLNTGENPGTPSIESLAKALRQDSTGKEILWLDVMANSGGRIFPYLDILRDPYLFVAGSGASSASSMQYLGVLDRLELLKRKE